MCNINYKMFANGNSTAVDPNGALYQIYYTYMPPQVYAKRKRPLFVSSTLSTFSVYCSTVNPIERL